MDHCAPGTTLDYLGCPSLLDIWMPCNVFTLTSTSTVSTGNWHLKYPWRKLYIPDAICMQSGRLALLLFQNFRVFAMLFCSIIYTVSCVPVAKVYHIIPCFSIRWKSKGSLIIKHLTLILSWSLMVTILGK